MTRFGTLREFGQARAAVVLPDPEASDAAQLERAKQARLADLSAYTTGVIYGQCPSHTQANLQARRLKIMDDRRLRPLVASERLEVAVATAVTDWINACRERHKEIEASIAAATTLEEVAAVVLWSGFPVYVPPDVPAQAEVSYGGQSWAVTVEMRDAVRSALAQAEMLNTEVAVGYGISGAWNAAQLQVAFALVQAALTE